METGRLIAPSFRNYLPTPLLPPISSLTPPWPHTSCLAFPISALDALHSGALSKHRAALPILPKMSPSLLFYTVIQLSVQAIRLRCLAGFSPTEFGLGADCLESKLSDLEFSQNLHKAAPLFEVEEVLLFSSEITFLLLNDSLFWHSIHLQISRQRSPAW